MGSLGCVGTLARKVSLCECCINLYNKVLDSSSNTGRGERLNNFRKPWNWQKLLFELFAYAIAPARQDGLCPIEKGAKGYLFKHGVCAQL